MTDTHDPGRDFFPAANPLPTPAPFTRPLPGAMTAVQIVAQYAFSLEAAA